MRLGKYVQMSTANPTGWRPWNSRLSGFGYYIANTYPLPTTGRGRYLLQPGVSARPSVNGGLGDGTSQIFGVTFDPTLMLAGLGVLLVAVFLSGRKPRPKRRRKRPGRIRRAVQQLATS